MKNLAEILKEYTEDDYESGAVDLHIHTAASDGEGDWNQILESAKNKNCKLISVTDHNTVYVHNTIQDEVLLTGVEFDCWYKFVFIHLLAYGIDINNENFKKFLSKNKRGTESAALRLFSFRNVKVLISAIHDAGGIAVLAHPACYWAPNLEMFVRSLIKIGLDGIEVYYPYRRFRKIVKFHSSKTVHKIADKYSNLIKTGGSDFHDKLY